jgi:hypothetical protein
MLTHNGVSCKSGAAGKGLSQNRDQAKRDINDIDLESPIITSGFHPVIY